MMRKNKCAFAALAGLAVLASPAFAGDFILTSTDIQHGEFMSQVQEFEGFGCQGGNQSPALAWQGAPEGTQAYAITVYDPDAPTGSGWWHWQLVNVPVNVTSLEAGAGGDPASLPKGSRSMVNDYGFAGFGGACPPQGHGAHRYQFTIHALSQPLDLPEGASAALTGYMINAYSLASSQIEALYKR